MHGDGSMDLTCNTPGMSYHFYFDSNYNINYAYIRLTSPTKSGGTQIITITIKNNEEAESVREVRDNKGKVTDTYRRKTTIKQDRNNRSTRIISRYHNGVLVSESYFKINQFGSVVSGYELVYHEDGTYQRIAYLNAETLYYAAMAGTMAVEMLRQGIFYALQGLYTENPVSGIYGGLLIAGGGFLGVLSAVDMALGFNGYEGIILQGLPWISDIYDSSQGGTAF